MRGSVVDRIVVIGASLAAVHAIDAFRSHDFAGEIVLVGDESHLPYDRPPLSKEGLCHPPEPDLLRPPEWYDDAGVSLMLGRTASRLDPAERTVQLTDGAELPYDGLVVATGSRARTLGYGDEHICYLRTVDDCARLHQQLSGTEHVAVLGAGFIGLEVAATLTEMGCAVTVVEMAPVPLARILGDQVGEWFHRFHARHGVDVRCGRPAVGVTADGTRFSVAVGGGERVHADLVVGALGAEPMTDWLRGSGVGLADGVLCDRALRTGPPGVVAAGDVVRWYNPLFDEDMRIEQWVNAVEQGRHAALTLLGGDEAYAPVPYFWSDQFEAKMRFVGRTNGAAQVRVEGMTEDSLRVVFGRGDTCVGALCVNATAHLPAYRAAIAAGEDYESIVGP